MGKDYRNRLCNVAACIGTSSNHCLFANRHPTPSQHLVIYKDFLDCTVRFTMLPDWASTAWKTSPLYKRGWVLQERYLATRILHCSHIR
jgi:hypothetical protein